jgi:pantoate--beta-alanine ligase
VSLVTLRTAAALREQTRAWRAAGLRIGVVPTMGALHEGHLSLVRAGFMHADRVIVTLFVNPRQFEDAADLAAYPRTEASDAAKLSPLGVHVLFAPDAAEMYPAGAATIVSVRGVSEGLCGAHRAGHFDGVATVVAKLLLRTAADVAIFGEKDFQQLQVVKRLVADLDIPAEIIPAPTVREADGLALSSRNVRISAADRRVAPSLFRALSGAAARISAGEAAALPVADARAALLAAGFERVEYLELRAAEGLQPLSRADRPSRLLAAAWLGGVRLIDNVEVPAGRALAA